MFKIKFAELPIPLFLGKKNLGLKQEPALTKGLFIFHDVQNKRVIFEYNGNYAIISDTNVILQPENPEDYGLVPKKEVSPPALVTTQGSTPQKRNISRTAQVGDPTRGIK